MDVRIVASEIGERPRRQYLITYVIDDVVAIDAGCLGLYGSPKRQALIRDVFLSHAHADHIASLPVFLENVYDGSGQCVRIHGDRSVHVTLRRDLFNDRVWPDLFRLAGTMPPFLSLETLSAGEPVEAGHLRVLPVAVNHTVPTLGFVVESETSAVVFASDTSATEEIWERANRTENLKGVFLEATFPNSMRELADVSRHLTPAGFAAEVRKLHVPVPVIAIHLKAAFHEAISAELNALELANVEIGVPGKKYRF